jgi:hypothetical protein
MESTAFPVDMRSPSDPISTENAVVTGPINQPKGNLNPLTCIMHSRLSSTGPRGNHGTRQPAARVPSPIERQPPGANAAIDDVTSPALVAL